MEANESQQQRKYSQNKKSDKNLTQNDVGVPKSNTVKIKNLNFNNNMGNQGYNNNYNNFNNQQNNYYGPYLPQRMQGIPGNQMYQNNNLMPQMQLQQGYTSAQTTDSNYIYSGGIYNK